MNEVDATPDFGTGEKKLKVYILGMMICVVLTLISFGVVTLDTLSTGQIFAIIFISAVLQFFVQVIFFLRLNTETSQGRLNVMVLLFTGIILLCIIAGSLWIMWNLHYYMMH